MLMVLHFKFKCQLRLCYLWSFSTFIMLETYIFTPIFMTFSCTLCAASALETVCNCQIFLCMLYLVIFQAEISSWFRIIYFQPDSRILDRKITEHDNRTAVGSITSITRKGLTLFRNAIVCTTCKVHSFLYLHLSQ